MHVPVPSAYQPWDDRAPEAFFLGTVDAYTAGAFAVLVFYDHLITIDREVATIWTRVFHEPDYRGRTYWQLRRLRWRLPKYLFLINRYVVPPLLLMSAIIENIYPLLQPPWTSVIAITTVELVLIVRVWALYERNKIILRFLIAFFTCEMMVVAVNTSILDKNTASILGYEFLPSCSMIIPSNTYSFWIPFVAFEGVMMSLTLYKLFGHRKDLNPTLWLIARDSSIYFIAMFASLLANVMFFRYDQVLPDVAMVPSACIACIAVSRMMMNIRSLALNAPRDIDSIQLDTVEFHSYPSFPDDAVLERSPHSKDQNQKEYV